MMNVIYLNHNEEILPPTGVGMPRKETESVPDDAGEEVLLPTTLPGSKPKKIVR